MLGVGRVEQPRRLVAAHDRGARDHRRHRSSLDEAAGGPRLELVHERDRGERRARARPGCRARRSRRARRRAACRGRGRRPRRRAGALPAWVGSPARDCATEVTATTASPRSFAPRAISIGTAESPLAEKTIITSCGRSSKFARMASARPGVRSMNIAWRWPFEPTTWVWKVIDSSTIGLKPGYDP